MRRLTFSCQRSLPTNQSKLVVWRARSCGTSSGSLILAKLMRREALLLLTLVLLSLLREAAKRGPSGRLADSSADGADLSRAQTYWVWEQVGVGARSNLSLWAGASRAHLRHLRASGPAYDRRENLISGSVADRKHDPCRCPSQAFRRDGGQSQHDAAPSTNISTRTSSGSRLSVASTMSSWPAHRPQPSLRCAPRTVPCDKHVFLAGGGSSRTELDREELHRTMTCSWWRLIRAFASSSPTRARSVANARASRTADPPCPWRPPQIAVTKSFVEAQPSVLAASVASISSITRSSVRVFAAHITSSSPPICSRTQSGTVAGDEGAQTPYDSAAAQSKGSVCGTALMLVAGRRPRLPPGSPGYAPRRMRACAGGMNPRKGWLRVRLRPSEATTCTRSIVAHARPTSTTNHEAEKEIFRSLGLLRFGRRGWGWLVGRVPRVAGLVLRCALTVSTVAFCAQDRPYGRKSHEVRPKWAHNRPYGRF